MAEQFNGFTQDEIKRMSVRKCCKPTANATSTAKRPTTFKRPIRAPSNLAARNAAKPQTKPRAASKAEAVANALSESSDYNLSITDAERLFGPQCRDSEEEGTTATAKTTASHASSEAGTTDLNSAATAETMRGISLKDFEKHRKALQEQNQQKKDLLYKAIDQHAQRTAAEARKIEEIRQELAKLEDNLAVDVGILRKEIETATTNFSTIEKQYLRIESEFLKAKVELHNAAERKELLTEHLCQVIAHNEDRKAAKLSELMDKVGLATTNGSES